MGAIRRSGHLVRRFFDVARARRLGPREQLAVARRLRSAEQDLFWGCGRADQRHGHDTAAALADVLGSRGRTRPDLERALLLHDVGKRHSGLGAVGRSLATVLAPVLRRGVNLADPRLRDPMSFTDRMRSYLAHGPVGAGELAAAGAERVVVAFAAGHQRPRTVAEGVSADDWRILVAADDTGPKARKALERLVG